MMLRARMWPVVCGFACISTTVPLLWTAPVRAQAAPAAETETMDEGPGATPSGGARPAAASLAQRKEAAKEVLLGQQARRGERHAEALRHFREAYGIVADVNTRLFIVRSLRSLGRMGEAYVEARTLISEADAAAAHDKRQQQTAMKARQELALVEQKVAFIRIGNPTTPHSELWVNHRQIPASEWSEPIAVTAGPVELVTGDDQRVEAMAKAGAEVTVTLPPPNEAPKTDGARAAASSKAAGGSGYHGPDRRLMALASASVGVIGMSLFGAFGAISEGQFARLDQACDVDGYCDPALTSTRDRGVATQLGANVSVVFGIVGLAGGAGLFAWDFFDPSDEDDSARARHGRPQLVLGPGHVSLRGSF